MTTLVTGASGFIGPYLVDHLRRSGTELVLASRRPAPDGGEPGVHKVQVNLDDPAWASDVMRRFRPDRIVHLAGLAFGRNDPLLVAPTFAANVKQSVELLEAALAADVNRVVMAGTFEEWDPRDEAHPNSPYAASKSAVTVYSQLFAGFGLDVVNARIFMCYGPGQHPDKLIPSLAASFLAGEEPDVRMPGRACDWIYVDDAAAGLAVLATHPLPDRDPSAGMSQFDVGTGTLTSIGEIARLLSASLGQEFACAAAPESERQVARCADPAPLQALGWAAQTDLRTGLELAIDDVEQRSR